MKYIILYGTGIEMKWKNIADRKKNKTHTLRLL